MKLLVLLFLVGYAAASVSFYDALDEAADEIVYDFMVGMDNAPSLKRALDFEDDEETDLAFALAEEDVKTELGKKLREALDKILQKIKDAVEQGKTVKGDLLEKLKDLKQKMKDLKIDVGEKAKGIFNKIKEKAKDFLKKILDELDLGGKEEEAAYIEFNIKDIFKKLKKAILDKIDKDALKAKIEKLFGKGSELADQLLNMLKEKGEKGKNKLLDLIDRILEGKEEPAFADEDIKTELGKKMREALDKLLEKIKDTVEQGKTVKGELIEKLKDLKQKMKDLKIKVGDKAKGIFQKIKDKAKDTLKKILDEFDLGGKDEDAFYGDDDIKTELGKKMREALDKLLEKIKDTVEQGKTVKGELIEKLKDLKQKMKDLKIRVGEKAKSIFQRIKDKAKDQLKKILDEFDLGGKDEDVAYAEFNIKNIFKKLKKAILDKIDKEALKAKIEKLFGKGSELADQLLNLLKEKGEKGKNKILDLIDRILEGKEETEFSVERRSIKDMWEKVKNYFKDLNIDLKEKFVKFGEWVKDTLSKGLDKSKTKLENIKQIAKEFTKHAKQVSKEVAVEALEFLRPYKEDLGELWEQVKESVKDVINRKD